MSASRLRASDPTCQWHAHSSQVMCAVVYYQRKKTLSCMLHSQWYVCRALNLQHCTQLLEPTQLNLYFLANLDAVCAGLTISISSNCNMLEPDSFCVHTGAVFGIAGALAMFHCTHKQILEQSNTGLPTPVGGKMLWCLHHHLTVNLKTGLLCPHIDMW